MIIELDRYYKLSASLTSMLQLIGSRCFGTLGVIQIITSHCVSLVFIFLIVLYTSLIILLCVHASDYPYYIPHWQAQASHGPPIKYGCFSHHIVLITSPRYKFSENLGLRVDLRVSEGPVYLLLLQV